MGTDLYSIDVRTYVRCGRKFAIRNFPPMTGASALSSESGGSTFALYSVFRLLSIMYSLVRIEFESCVEAIPSCGVETILSWDTFPFVWAALGGPSFSRLQRP